MLCRQPRLSVRPILTILCAIAATILFQPNPAHAQSLTAFTGNYTVAVEPSSLQQGQKLEELPLSGRIEILSLPLAGLGGFLLRGVELGMPNRGFRTLVDRTREMQFSPIYTANRGGDRNQRFLRYALPTGDRGTNDLFGWAVVRPELFVAGTVQIDINGQSVMRQFDVGLAKTEEAKSPTPGNRQVARPFRLREWRDGKSTLDISGELR
jgi:hypothetical protein